MPMHEVEMRYRNDVNFHRAVDCMRSILAQYHMTPGELREAVILAAYLHEMDNPLPQLRREADIRAFLELRRSEDERYRATPSPPPEREPGT